MVLLRTVLYVNSAQRGTDPPLNQSLGAMLAEVNSTAIGRTTMPVCDSTMIPPGPTVSDDRQWIISTAGGRLTWSIGFMRCEERAWADMCAGGPRARSHTGFRLFLVPCPLCLQCAHTSRYSAQYHVYGEKLVSFRLGLVLVAFRAGIWGYLVAVITFFRRPNPARI